MTDESHIPTADQPAQGDAVDPARWAEQAGTRAAADLEATLAGRILAHPFSTEYVDPAPMAGPTADDVFRARVREATGEAADGVLAQVGPDADPAQVIDDTLRAGMDAAGDVVSDYLLFGNTPVEDRPGMITNGPWPAPLELSHGRPFTREHLQRAMRTLYGVPEEGPLDVQPVALPPGHAVDVVITDDPVRPDAPEAPGYAEARDSWYRRLVADATGIPPAMLTDTDTGNGIDLYLPSKPNHPTSEEWRRKLERHTDDQWRTIREEQAAHLARQARAEILGRLDIDPWRVPADGLLEYDPVHDEWRVELLAAGDDYCAGPPRTVIVRRYAGRKRWARPPRGVVDLSPYIDSPDAHVWFRPGTPQSDPPSMADLQGRGGSEFAQLVERHRRLAQAFRSTKRVPSGYARGGRIRPFPAKPERDDQVDAMSYSVRHFGSPPTRALADLVGEMGTKLADGAAAAAGAVVHINATTQALRPLLAEFMRERRDRA